MAVRKTIQIGDQVLRETAEAVNNVGAVEIHALIEDLKDTMREADLVGIAAPQIGESVRIFISEIRETEFRKAAETDPLTVHINPEIVQISDEIELGYEGCGSIAHSGLFGEVKRAKEITVKYTDELGVSREKSASGLVARIIQHEIDHLNGIMFTDLCDPKTLVSREYYIEHIAKR